MQSLKLILVGPDGALCSAWRRAFNGMPAVEIVHGRFEDLPEYDCMVTAANSFGLMDGGVDAAVVAFFGYGLMERVQQTILDEYQGEQPVGTSLIVETAHPRHPYVAHTPTMRVPMSIAWTDNVYLAMRAALLAVRAHNGRTTVPIRRLACPGLGTATGRVPCDEAARQMAIAYRSFLDPPRFLDWNLASRRQEEIEVGGDMGFLLRSHAETRAPDASA